MGLAPSFLFSNKTNHIVEVSTPEKKYVVPANQTIKIKLYTGTIKYVSSFNDEQGHFRLKSKQTTFMSQCNFLRINVFNGKQSVVTLRIDDTIPEDFTVDGRVMGNKAISPFKAKKKKVGRRYTQYYDLMFYFPDDNLRGNVDISRVYTELVYDNLSDSFMLYNTGTDPCLWGQPNYITRFPSSRFDDIFHEYFRAPIILEI